jgi:hypothetical protein
MSNRIDFFPSDQTQLALPGATVSISLDGSLCPYLELIEIVRSNWPEFSWARLIYNPAVHPQAGLIVAEEIEVELAIGKRVCIRQIYNGTAPGASAFSFPIFAGQIEGIETKLVPERERVEIIARDFSANLKRVTVYGQWVGSSDGSILFLAGSDTVFNEDGKTNALIEPVVNNGNGLTVFCAEPSQGKLWSYAEVIDYLLCEYLPNGQLQTPSIGQLQTLTENQVVRDLDVTGLNLIEALRQCCGRSGLKFKFVPRDRPEVQVCPSTYAGRS